MRHFNKMRHLKIKYFILLFSSNLMIVLYVIGKLLNIGRIKQVFLNKVVK